MNSKFSKQDQKSVSNDNVHPKILRQAQQSGLLNLTDRSLKSVPDAVWDLNTPLPPENANAAIDLNRDAGDYRWWETQPITRLILTSNQLTSIPGDGLAKLNTLTHLDLRDNQLSSLPEEIGQLTDLRVLNLSMNRLQTLPVGLSQLGGLTQLDVSKNQLERLGDHLHNLVNLDSLDLSDNKLSDFPTQLPSHIRRLNLRSNRLERLPEGLLDQIPDLQELDISSNALSSLVLFNDSQSASNCCQLVSLYATFNKFGTMPVLTGLKALKELYLSDNQITDVNLESLHGCPLITLDLARNKISTLPNGLPAAFPDLVRLDVSSNNLSNLPTELGLMDRLQVLLVDLNPLRSIRHNIIASGTEALKSLLRQRHNPEPAGAESAPVSQPKTCAPVPTEQNTLASPCAAEPVQTKATPAPPQPVPALSSKSVASALPSVNQSGLLDWSAETKGPAVAPIPSLPDPDSTEAWLSAATPPHMTGANVRTLQLSHRKLTSVPVGLFAFTATLTSLSLDNNKLTDLPDCMDSLSRLTTLDLSRNQFHSIPACLASLPSLITLRLDKNPLGPVCAVDPLTDGPVHTSLEHLSLRGCQLTQSPQPALLGPDRMPNLSHLDLSDNEIGTVPPELGLCTQLKSLQLGGNTFRIPRPALLAKGTPAVLEYLRSRIPS